VGWIRRSSPFSFLAFLGSQDTDESSFGAEQDTYTNEFTPLDVISNSFCAGGSVLANGTWTNSTFPSPFLSLFASPPFRRLVPSSSDSLALAVGGNAAVGPLGVGLAANSSNPYGSVDGGKAARLFTPCDGDGTCEWTDHTADMPLSRWYPT
jgi:hypothetical protein